MESELTIDTPELQLHGAFEGTACPVQVLGTVAHHSFYFRSRHDRWSFAVQTRPEFEAEDVYFPDQGFIREGRYGTGPHDASYMPPSEARRIINDCAREFLQNRNA